MFVVYNQYTVIYKYIIAGFPNDKTLPEANNEEDDQKSYSSDSESDKDSKDSKSESKTDTDVSMPNTDHDEEKIVQSSNSINTDSESSCTPDSTQLHDPEVEENAEKQTTVEDGETEKSDNDQCKSNSIKECTESEEEKKMDSESDDTEISRTASTKANESDTKDDQKMDCDDKASENNQFQSKEKESRVFDVVDNDDYLLYLEDILKKIHRRFFEEYRDDQQNGSDGQVLPDLKKIVPELRREVLKGVNIVFSGVVPQQMKLKDSKAYFIATSLGASVSERLIVKVKGDTESDHKKMYTTHMVAANLHTEKVNVARKYKYIKVYIINDIYGSTVI